MDTSPAELAARDNQAIQRSLGELNDGDTLVYINYPNNVHVVDSLGFPVPSLHRVHSVRLINSSDEFRKLFDDTHQLAARRKKGFGPGKKRLPPGVSFIIDLTPPDFDDDALELTIELSCSPGILRWFTAVKRLTVSRTMAGGTDESAANPLSSPATSPAKGTSLPIITYGFTPQASGSGGETGSSSTSRGFDNEAALNAALKQSTEGAEKDGSGEINEDNDERKAESQHLDYSQIRHRVGIERLLKIIENKDPRLDSAPKVWTLAVLAKFFGCSQVVAGHVFTWFIAEPNCQIIDILPEATMKIGMTIENYDMTRAAFAILVSEEAMRCGSKIFMDASFWAPDGAFNSRPESKKFTCLGRIKEPRVLDEDSVNLIQHAGRAFAARVEAVVTNLLDPKMGWVQCLPEFAKLQRFLESDSGESLFSNEPDWIEEINECKQTIVDWIKGRLFTCLTRPLDFTQEGNLKDHYNARNWDRSIEVEYDTLLDYERIMTRFFWEHVRNVDWHNHETNNLVLVTGRHLGPTWNERNEKLAKANKIPKVMSSELRYCMTGFNAIVTSAIQSHGYLGGVLPNESYRPVADTSAQDTNGSLPAGHGPAFTPNFTSNNPNPGLDYYNSNNEAHSSTAHDAHISPDNVSTTGILDLSIDTQAGPSNLSARQNSKKRTTRPREIYATGPPDDEIPDGSPFFSLTRLFREVQTYVRNVSVGMLKRGQCAPLSNLCDNITCLSEAEFKFLPLWAGGLNDGTGGVFEEHVPAAGRGAFSGPGPAYHTGSTNNSSMGSDDFDVLSEADASTIGAGSSMAVDDGHSSHLDRRMVIGDDGFAADEFEVVHRPKPVPVYSPDEDHEHTVDSHDTLEFDGDDQGRATPKAGSEAGNVSDDDMDLGIDEMDDLHLYDA